MGFKMLMKLDLTSPNQQNSMFKFEFPEITRNSGPAFMKLLGDFLDSIVYFMCHEKISLLKEDGYCNIVYSVDLFKGRWSQYFADPDELWKVLDLTRKMTQALRVVNFLVNNLNK